MDCACCGVATQVPAFVAGLIQSQAEDTMAYLDDTLRDGFTSVFTTPVPLSLAADSQLTLRFSLPKKTALGPRGVGVTSRLQHHAWPQLPTLGHYHAVCRKVGHFGECGMRVCEVTRILG